MRRWQTVALTVLMIGLALAGCGQPEGSEAVASAPPACPPLPPPPLAPGTSYVYTADQDPATTHYEGQGVTYERIVKGMTGYWPTASAAGTVVGSQKPFEAKVAPTAEVSIAPEGVVAQAQAKGTTMTGGSSMVSIATRIWGGITTWLWIIGLGAVALVVIYFAFPAAQPVLALVGRAIASIFPFIGSLVERAVGAAKTAAVEKPLVQTVQGIQEAKDVLDGVADYDPLASVTIPPETPWSTAQTLVAQAIEKTSGLTKLQKEEVRATINATLNESHDRASAAVVKEIKATL